MEVESQEFPRRVRGYDPDDVRMYLRAVAAEVEKLNLENATLREEVGKLQAQAQAHGDRERALRETLVTAKEMASTLEQKSREESNLMVKEARLKSERMLERAQDQLTLIETEISRAKLERDFFENRLRSVIEEHGALLDLRKRERSEKDNLRFLRRRTTPAAG
jgi:cell division initiation protein